MRNSIFNLVIGILWYPLWGYHFYKWYLVKGKLIYGILELMVTMPLGFAFLYDWFVFGRRKLPSFIMQESWNPGDFAFFVTGIGGVISILAGLFFVSEHFDPVLTGFIGVALALTHLFRRRFYMGKPMF